ncbi:Lrp/AsnC family transcriptional regulator (plasmid) [Mesorhizobium sp. AR02]|uniref:Lrp/AsnC family transcriptional regulator n=1 Tax=Mesorhizobium sp. AR02 TaxID=2865837 RepID=UPI00215FC975|nr:Lrp/AsnC family transcriptional regulator [Mesorhizobium sp. AR02]UVK49664.1 Lrp/AsnC family transcriptional regulator [Mesorhizobium sp. AR02]
MVRSHSAKRSVDLDEFDLAILDIVQRDRETPLRVIAERVNRSTAAVQRRLRRLEEVGVITAHVALVDSTLVGKPITVIVEVHIDRVQLDLLNEIKRRFSGPEVQQCYYVAGEADFVLILSVATMEEYNCVVHRLFYTSEDVKWFRSTVVMDRVKVGLTIPLATE